MSATSLFRGPSFRSLLSGLAALGVATAATPSFAQAPSYGYAFGDGSFTAGATFSAPVPLTRAGSVIYCGTDAAPAGKVFQIVRADQVGSDGNFNGYACKAALATGDFLIGDSGVVIPYSPTGPVVVENGGFPFAIGGIAFNGGGWYGGNGRGGPSQQVQVTVGGTKASANSSSSFSDTAQGTGGLGQGGAGGDGKGGPGGQGYGRGTGTGTGTGPAQTQSPRPPQGQPQQYEFTKEQLQKAVCGCTTFQLPTQVGVRTPFTVGAEDGVIGSPNNSGLTVSGYATLLPNGKYAVTPAAGQAFQAALTGTSNVPQGRAVTVGSGALGQLFASGGTGVGRVTGVPVGQTQALSLTAAGHQLANGSWSPQQQVDYLVTNLGNNQYRLQPTDASSLNALKRDDGLTGSQFSSITGLPARTPGADSGQTRAPTGGMQRTYMMGTGTSGASPAPQFRGTGMAMTGRSEGYQRTPGVTSMGVPGGWRANGGGQPERSMGAGQQRMTGSRVLTR